MGHTEIHVPFGYEVGLFGLFRHTIDPEAAFFVQPWIFPLFDLKGEYVGRAADSKAEISGEEIVLPSSSH